MLYFLRGFAQIMFQESALTGIVFLIGIAVNSLIMCVGAILGAASSVICAKLLKVDATDFTQGLYGYNGALAGIMMLLFYQPSISSLILIMLAGVLSSIMMRIMLYFSDSVPPYTAPFLISIGLLLMVAKLFSITLVSVESVLAQSGELAALARGIGQVLLQDNWVSGVFFLVGITLHSKSAAIWAVIGSGGGMLLANQFTGNLVLPFISIILSVVPLYYFS